MTAIDDLVSGGRYLDAIEELTAANRLERDPQREVLLADLRHRAWDEIAATRAPAPARAPGPDQFADVDGLPSVAFDDLTVDVLASAIDHHSGLIVRNLFTAEQCRSLNADIDRTLEAVDARTEGRPDDVAPEWYTFRPGTGPEFELGSRVWLHQSGTVWTGESPRTMFDLFEVLEDRQLPGLLSAYFGERPALSLIKCALRRVKPDAVGGWHQDGYVLGGDTRVLNVWIATSPCGANAPGLDVVPRPMRTLAPTSAPPPMDFCIGDDTIAELAADRPVIRPEFGAGDALIFNQYLLHRTATGGEFTDARYGFECWFFAPSTFPVKWVPIAF